MAPWPSAPNYPPAMRRERAWPWRCLLRCLRPRPSLELALELAKQRGAGSASNDPPRGPGLVRLSGARRVEPPLAGRAFRGTATGAINLSCVFTESLLGSRARSPRQRGFAAVRHRGTPSIAEI